MGSTRVDGLPQLARAFAAIDASVRKEIFPAVVRKQSTKLRNAIRDRAPRDTGRLARAIITKVLKPEFSGVQSAVTIRRGKTRNDPNGAFYWGFVEFGSVKQPAQPFVRPAVSIQTKEIPKNFTSDAAALVERVRRRVYKKQAKGR